MTTKVYFPIAESAPNESIVLDLTSGAQFVGDDRDSSLACGNCKRVFARNMSTLDFVMKLVRPATSLPVYVKCQCGSLNLVRR